jgi:protein KTI12
MISSSQTVAGGGLGGILQVEVGQTRLPLELPARNVALSELQRVKRQFVAVHKKAITQGVMESGEVDWSEEGVMRKFVEYLTERWSEN